MVKKLLRNVVASSAAAGMMILPAATSIAPQIQNVACKYPRSIVTQTKLIYPTVIEAHTTHIARVNVDGKGGPNGTVRFKLGKHGDPVFKNVVDGSPVRFKFGETLKGGRTYVVRAKFFGNCRYRNSSDQGKVTVLKP